jgi:protoporphyrinogen oxidase
MNTEKKAIIIGAGPAGLTAGLELLKRTGIKPIILEATGEIGGISKTFHYNGNFMDMGGHRFFSKSDAVMNWWLDILPLQGSPSVDDILLSRKIPLSDLPDAPDPQKHDEVMLVRHRLSRIFYLGKFFDYPVSLNLDTIKNLGFVRMMKIGFSYLWSRVSKIKDEKSLEDFMINRFGKELYLTFFKDYTQKVWGVEPKFIPADWGAQRIKELSIAKVLIHAFKKLLPKKRTDIAQKDVEVSLIEQFIYPKFGPGFLWERVAKRICDLGGEIVLNAKVSSIQVVDGKVSSVQASINDVECSFVGDHYLSTMPVKDLINAIDQGVPETVKEVANGLMYRDFITVGLLLNKLKLLNKTNIKTVSNIVPDLWIYIQERQVKIGRLQVFNNWSPYMVKNFENHVWLGLEYFCNAGDELWSKDDKEFLAFAEGELESIGIIDKGDVLDGCVVRVPKAYPAYFGTYKRFNEIQSFTNSIDNLYLIGRNGMHRYNNMDHSMMTAMTAVDNIVNGVTSKDNLWQINMEEDYHEVKAEEK